MNVRPLPSSPRRLSNESLLQWHGPSTHEAAQSSRPSSTLPSLISKPLMTPEMTVVSSGAAVVTVASLLKLLTSWRKCLITMPVTCRWWKTSSPFHIESGVLQGSVLSPCLYSIFLDDLAYELSNLAKVRRSALINCTMYADDIVFIRNWSWGP